MSSAQAKEHSHPRYGWIWFYLLILTVVEVGVGALYMRFEGFRVLGVLTLIVLASWKAAMVGAYFMHLKFETRTMIAIVLVPFVLLVVLACALMPDVW